MVRTTPLNRRQIAQFIATPSGVTAFENLQADSVATGGSVDQAGFLVTSADAAPAAGRVLAPVSGDLVGTDGGAGGTYALGLADTAVAAGNYGDAGHLVSLEIDAKGRITRASQSAIGAGPGISYTAGEIALQPSGVTAGTYTTIRAITIDEYGRVTALS